MGQPELARDFSSEAELIDFAGCVASAWQAAAHRPLIVGLRGDLGSGKTTWVRAMLRGLGYTGRVPSPTYTLLEPYEVAGLSVLHLDLYRLGGEDELENLGVRDWLADNNLWLLVEWPERAARLAGRVDVEIGLDVAGPSARRVVLAPRTQAGIRALEDCRRIHLSNTP